MKFLKVKTATNKQKQNKRTKEKKKAKRKKVIGKQQNSAFVARPCVNSRTKFVNKRSRAITPVMYVPVRDVSGSKMADSICCAIPI